MRNFRNIREELLAEIASLDRELERAPIWKRGTTWWLDRERELLSCQRRLEALRAPPPS